MKILTWNVRGYTGPTKREQLAEVLRMAPDIIALQEVVAGSLGYWRAELANAGHEVLTSDIELLNVQGPFLPRKRRRFRRRKNLNLIASKRAIRPLSGLSFEDPRESFPEKYLAAEVDVDGRRIDVHNAHVPPGATVKMRKVDFFEAIRRRIDERTQSARILCGDFNSPWSEDDGGFVVGGDRRNPEEENRWKAAERGFLEHPKMRDVYRAGRREGERFAVSHRRGRGRKRTACRYDHIYISEHDFDMSRCRCEYREDLLERGLSDHAPVLASLELRSRFSA